MPHTPASHANNFDFIRFAAATLVLFNHHYTLTGQGELSFLGINTLSGLAVSVFFCLSGYLVTQSWFADPHPVRFAQRRILRIWPALTVVVLLSAFVLGPLLGKLAAGPYFRHIEVWQYLDNLLMQPAWYLPGVFETNISRAVNGSLWTIPLEVQCYTALILAGLVGILSSHRTLARFALLYIAWYTFFYRPELHGKIHYPLEFAAYFMAGAFLFATRSHWQARPWSWSAGVALAAALLWHYQLRYLGALIAVSWLSISLGQMRTPILSRFGRYGDFSYGIYLYAFPVQQTVILLGYPQTGFWANMLIAFLLTCACAIASWYLIEKPALSYKPRRAAPAPQTWQTLLHSINPRKLASFGFFAARPLAVIALASVLAWLWRSAQPAPPLTFFTPLAYPAELARRTELGMILAHDHDTLQSSLQTAKDNHARLNIDFTHLLLLQRPAEALKRTYHHEGQTYPKSFAPRSVNKVKNLPDNDTLRKLLAPYWTLLKTYEAQIAAIFLVDEPYMHGISKAEMERLAAQMRLLLAENGLENLPLGITFGSAMFDRGFAERLSAQADAWVHNAETHYAHLQSGTSAAERAQLAEWQNAFATQRLTTYDLAGHYYTGGGIPDGYDIIAYNLYTATLLQDAVQSQTLAYFAELGASPACEAFRGQNMNDIRQTLSFYQDGGIVADSLAKDRPLLDAIFTCKSESLLHLVQKQRKNGQRLMLWGESSSNGFLEFTAAGRAKNDQPELLIAARVQEEVQRTLIFYDRHAREFDAGIMFFLWDDATDHSVELELQGAHAMPGVTRLVFDRIGKP